jgi:hypothetical protein
MNAVIARRAALCGLVLPALRGAWAQGLPSVNGQRPEVAFISQTSVDASPAQRGYTKVLADQIRARLTGDPSMILLPTALNADAVVGMPVPGFVASADELTQAVRRLPAICNTVLVFGPHPGRAGLFPVRVLRRGTVAGITFYISAPKGDLPSASEIDQVFGTVRQDIATINKSSR